MKKHSPKSNPLSHLLFVFSKFLTYPTDGSVCAICKCPKGKDDRERKKMMKTPVCYALERAIIPRSRSLKGWSVRHRRHWRERRLKAKVCSVCLAEAKTAQSDCQFLQDNLWQNKEGGYSTDVSLFFKQKRDFTTAGPEQPLSGPCSSRFQSSAGNPQTDPGWYHSRPNPQQSGQRPCVAFWPSSFRVPEPGPP